TSWSGKSDNRTNRTRRTFVRFVRVVRKPDGQDISLGTCPVCPVVSRERLGKARNAPALAANLVRQHAESVFNEATQRLASGPNQFGGAKFAATIAGNPQQRRNLEAAVGALPDGDTRWRGFNRLLQVLEASGQRQRPGSMTAFNAQAMRDLEQGGLSEAAAAPMSPQKIIQ